MTDLAGNATVPGKRPGRRGLQRGRPPCSVLVGLLLVGMAGCEAEAARPGEAVLGELEAGVTREEVLARLPPGGLEPSEPSEAAALAGGYGLDRYFLEGRFIEVLWVHDPQEGPPSGSDEHRTRLTPVVFADDAMDGWGWPHFDRRREEWGILEWTPRGL